VLINWRLVFPIKPASADNVVGRLPAMDAAGAESKWLLVGAHILSAEPCRAVSVTAQLAVKQQQQQQQ